ncbi:MAG: TRAP transporter permease [Alphaproteobacteria bacterium]
MAPPDQAQPRQATEQELQELVAQSDTGARSLGGSIGVLLAVVAFSWSLFQIYFASPLPFLFTQWLPGGWTLNDHEARAIHLGFAVFLGFCAYPAYFRERPRLGRLMGWFLLLAGLVALGVVFGSYFDLTAQAIYDGMRLPATADPAQIEESFAQARTMASESGHAPAFLPWIAGLLGAALLIAGNPLVADRVLRIRPAPATLMALAGVALGAWFVFSIGDVRDGLVAFFGTDDRAVRSLLTVAAGGYALLVLAIPAFDRASRTRISPPEWLIALVAAFCASYLFWFYQEVTSQSGRPSDFSMVVSVIGLATLLEATRRSLGPPLMLIGLIFLSYTFLGPYMPDVIAHKGQSLAKVAEHQWLTTQGVFGTALGVSTLYVFLFVLFGSLLDKAGAGNYFIQVAFSLLGHLRGGPAKAAVVASGMTGLISGSSIANVVTTGTFTIPLMKRVGFSGEKAGAVEVASSVNGQIMPPVMGAAAFLMAEYVGIPYSEVVKHAFLPAIISYIALIYIVHLEALKAGMQGLPRPGEPIPAKWKLISFGITTASILIIAGVAYWAVTLVGALDDPGAMLAAVAAVIALQVLLYMVAVGRADADRRVRTLSMAGLVLCNVVLVALLAYYGIAVLRQVAGDAAIWLIVAVLAGVYLYLLRVAARSPDLHMDDPNAPIVGLPEVGPTVRSGLHFLLPVAVLIWCLMVERLSPGLSAFWALMLLIFVSLTQRPLIALMRGQGALRRAAAHGLGDFVAGMIAGARNMIGIGIATAAAGIIVGSVTLTGVGQVLADMVELLSMGDMILMLVWVAILSLILGMGLPTTANYIVVSSLLAPVVVALGAQNGLVVPLIAVHMFVFYFGIMADVTPPVGLASFAAAAVSGADPIRTGIVAFAYSLRTVALPFIFIFNTQLLLIGIEDVVDLMLVVGSAVIAMLVFAAATQGWFFARNRLYESAALLLVAFTLFRPGYWMDMLVPPLEAVDPAQMEEVVAATPDGATLQLVVEGMTIEGRQVTRTVRLPTGPSDLSGRDRLSQHAGLEVRHEPEGSFVDMLTFGGAAEQQGVDFDWRILRVELAADQPPKQLFFIPALLLLGVIIWLQRLRLRQARSAAIAV